MNKKDNHCFLILLNLYQFSRMKAKHLLKSFNWKIAYRIPPPRLTEWDPNSPCRPQLSKLVEFFPPSFQLCLPPHEITKGRQLLCHYCKASHFSPFDYYGTARPTPSFGASSTFQQRQQSRGKELHALLPFPFPLGNGGLLIHKTSTLVALKGKSKGRMDSLISWYC